MSQTTQVMNATICELLNIIGFSPKESTTNIHTKTYKNGATIEIDLKNEKILYDKNIRKYSETTSNFSKAENFVVLECVDRLLETGYKAENIILEKTWKLGHADKGLLDILVTKTEKNGQETAYLMIECKTAGKEFDKAFKKIYKDGGQLFSYLQQDKSAEILMLYASELKADKIAFKNEIISVTENIRTASSAQQMFERWDKLTKTNGIFENVPYNFAPKVLTIDTLIPLAQEQSGKIFNGFLEILRHNVVSDKPNAFNKIFSLFLCKIYDELEHDTERPQDRTAPLDFQYIQGESDETFQLRLNDLYKRGMKALLDKTITDISLSDFDTKYKNFDEKAKAELRQEIIKLRLQKNNEFAIKDVFDEDSFQQNAIVVREVVELLQPYKLRYTHKNQFLSDFFELLLTTGLKQESGQFFTTVPVAQFILKSIPIDHIITEKLQNGEVGNYLPHIIDYASGSGHFLTESMDIVQQFIEQHTDSLQLQKTVRNFVNQAKTDNYNWAKEYIYGIEKDYRLVKVGKVGCHLHGDGLANVIHSDGLAQFSHKEYTGILQHTDKDFPQENKQFDIVVSNPPYSVSEFKNVTSNYYTEANFELYKYLTEQSSEIEALFVERTKQLLRDGGTAGIILPSSILSNTGIYTKAREIILQYFDIVAITELGSNTFMATGTNTVVLFLRRRNNYEVRNLKQSIEQVFQNGQDVTLNGIENALSKYIAHVWEGISLEDYISLLQKKPTENIEKQDLFKEYRKKLFIDYAAKLKKPKPEQLAQAKEKSEREFWGKLLKIEKEKFAYFLLSYNKKVVLITSGQKDEEKRFLGYEFSNRRGSEGIHPIQKGTIAMDSQTIDPQTGKVKTHTTTRHIRISDCTKLFDEHAWTNPEKASTYVYKAFLGEYPEIHDSLKKHISHAFLHYMLTFDRPDFDKLISTSVKKKVVFESKWELVRLGDVAEIDWGNTNLTKKIFKDDGLYDVYTAAGLDGKTDFYEQNGEAIVLSAIGARCGKCFLANEKWTAIKNTIVIKNKANVLLKYLFELINNENYWKKSGTAQPFITLTSARQQKLPLPPLEIQQKIVSEIEALEEQEETAKNEVEKLKAEIGEVIQNMSGEQKILSEITTIQKGTSITKQKIKHGNIPVIAGGKTPAYFHNISNRDGNVITVSASGANSGFVNYFTTPIFASDCNTIVSKNEAIISTKLIYEFLKTKQEDIYQLQRGQAQPHVYAKDLAEIKIPLPPLEVQQTLMSKIEKLEEGIAVRENELAEIPKKKEEALKKWLV